MLKYLLVGVPTNLLTSLGSYQNHLTPVISKKGLALSHEEGVNAHYPLPLGVLPTYGYQ